MPLGGYRGGLIVSVRPLTIHEDNAIII